jgi:hypothetical protein
MNGILSGLPQGALMDPREAMITQMGLGLLANSGPSLTPSSFGANFGKAGMQGLQAYQQAQQGNQQQQLFKMKLAEVQREAEERKKKEAAMAALRADPRFAGMGSVLDVAPNAAIQQVLAKPERARTAADAQGVLRYVDGPQAGQPVPGFTATKPQAPLSDLGKLEDDFKAGRIPEADYKAKKAKLLSPSQPLVTVDNRQEGKFSEAVGKEMGEQYAGLLKADMNAPVNIGKYQRLGQLLSSVNTGKFKGTTTDLKAAAKSLGFDLTALGIADDVAPAQAARSLTNQLALEARNPAGGAGMPGALSDKDREFLVQSIPGLENDPASIPTMIDYRVRLEKRSQQVAKMARAYRKKNGGKFDEGFFDELQEWSEKNPLFPEAATAPKPVDPKGAGLSADEQKELEALRQRFKK